MNRPTEDYAAMGLTALKRATRKAFERARQNHLQVPIWKDAKIEYINLEIDTEQLRNQAGTSLMIGTYGDNLSEK